MDNPLFAPFSAADYETYRALRQTYVVDAKTLGPFVPAARLMLRHAVQEAGAAAPERARELLGVARRFAYNLGADTWPGWNDGTQITREHQAIGREAAVLCLALDQQLGSGEVALAKSTWLVGAHALAAGDLAAARAAFKKSGEFAQAEVGKLLVEGYLALTDLVGGDLAARGRLADARARLAAAEPGAADQFDTAEAAFAPRD